MPVTRSQAKEICTKDELELVESSFAPAVNALPAARLKSRIDRARKLQDKYRELERSQNRAAKDSTSGKTRTANARTARKARLFDETRARFEKRLARLDDGGE
jgi:hypothetical protein